MYVVVLGHTFNEQCVETSLKVLERAVFPAQQARDAPHQRTMTTLAHLFIWARVDIDMLSEVVV